MTLPFAVARTLGLACVLLLSHCTLFAQGPEPLGNREPVLQSPDRPKSALDRAEEGVAEPEENELETDRDSFTPSPRTVGNRRLMAEAAYSFIDNRGVAETHSFPELLLRYGLSRRIELRVGFNYEVGGARNSISVAGAEDVAVDRGLERAYTVSYGVKLLLTDHDRWLPVSSLIVMGRTSLSEIEQETNVAATYVFGWELPGKWLLDAAIHFNTATEEDDRFVAWSPSVVLKAPIGERWKAHVEYFSSFSSGRSANFAKHFLSPGVHCLLTPNLELGVRVGWGLNDQSSRFFANAGVGWRF